MATRVVSHLHNALGLDLTVRAVLHAPGVAQLSHSLAGDRLSLLHAVAQVNHLRSEEG